VGGFREHRPVLRPRDCINRHARPVPPPYSPIAGGDDGHSVQSPWPSMAWPAVHEAGLPAGANHLTCGSEARPTRQAWYVHQLAAGASVLNSLEQQPPLTDRSSPHVQTLQAKADELAGRRVHKVRYSKYSEWLDAMNTAPTWADSRADAPTTTTLPEPLAAPLLERSSPSLPQHPSTPTVRDPWCELRREWVRQRSAFVVGVLGAFLRVLEAVHRHVELAYRQAVVDGRQPAPVSSPDPGSLLKRHRDLQEERYTMQMEQR
jgi:hypothetical protein